MAEENIHRKRIEEPPEGAMPEDSPQETAARQSAEDSPLPPADLPVDGKGEKGPDSPKKDYIEKIKEYYEKLFSNESNLTKILNENGLKVLAPWVKRTRKLLEEDEIAKSCLGYTLDALSKKYQNGTEELEKVILTDPGPESLEQEARRQGMITMREDGMLKVLEGQVGLEQITQI